MDNPNAGLSRWREDDLTLGAIVIHELVCACLLRLTVDQHEAWRFSVAAGGARLWQSLLEVRVSFRRPVRHHSDSFEADAQALETEWWLCLVQRPTATPSPNSQGLPLLSTPLPMHRATPLEPWLWVVPADLSIPRLPITTVGQSELDQWKEPPKTQDQEGPAPATGPRLLDPVCQAFGSSTPSFPFNNTYTHLFSLILDSVS